jgi:hypothetical protein
MNGPGGASVALRAATLRYGRHLIWEHLDLDVADHGTWPGPTALPTQVPQRWRPSGTWWNH